MGSLPSEPRVTCFTDDYDCRVNATNASQCAWAANQTVGGNPPFIGPACTWDPEHSACGGGPPQKKGKGGGGAWSQVANCKVQGWNTSASPGYSAELRKLGTLDHFDHLILENALFWANYSGYSVVPGPMGGPGHQPDIPFSTWDNTSLVAESLSKVLSRM